MGTVGGTFFGEEYVTAVEIVVGSFHIVANILGGVFPHVIKASSIDTDSHVAMGVGTDGEARLT